jgi:hypothetical protein
MIITAAKHSKIDDAQASAHRVQQLLRRFQRELADVAKSRFCEDEFLMSNDVIPSLCSEQSLSEAKDLKTEILRFAQNDTLRTTGNRLDVQKQAFAHAFSSRKSGLLSPK